MEPNTTNCEDQHAQTTVNVSKNAQGTLTQHNVDEEMQSTLQQHYNSYVKDGLQ